MRAMKDSGIEWIGKIPENWGISPLRSKFSFGKGLSITKADLCEEGVPVISYGQIHSKDNSGVSAHESLIRHLPKDHENLSPTSLALKGDFIFADTSEDLQGCGNCVYIDKEYPIYAGYHTLIAHPKDEQTGKFYAYLFTCDAWRAQVRANVSGVKLYSITQDILRRTYLLDPPTDEQAKIVQYLDKKCTDIDLLIKAKEKSNALLKERRQSIIYEAVTKGLDPTVPMKDSGVEWIGEIPEGWRVVELKRVGIPATGSTPSKDNLEYWDGNIPWVSSKDMKSDYLYDSEDHITQTALEECGLTIFNPGSLLFCVRSGILRHTFPVAVAMNPVTINQDIRALSFTLDINPSYLLYYMRGMNDIIVTLYQKVGATVESIEMDWFLHFPVVLPPIEEQKRIADTLREQCGAIDQSIGQNDMLIKQFKEYRQSLIFEAATGKMEVKYERGEN